MRVCRPLRSVPLFPRLSFALYLSKIIFVVAMTPALSMRQK